MSWSLKLNLKENGVFSDLFRGHKIKEDTYYFLIEGVNGEIKVRSDEINKLCMIFKNNFSNQAR